MASSARSSSSLGFAAWAGVSAMPMLSETSSVLPSRKVSGSCIPLTMFCATLMAFSSTLLSARPRLATAIAPQIHRPRAGPAGHFLQMHSQPYTDVNEHFISCRMAKAVVDLFEVIDVNKQQRQRSLRAQRVVTLIKRIDEKCAVTQAGQAVVLRLVRQGVILNFQVILPGLHLSQQTVEVTTQGMQLGNRRGRCPQIKGAVGAYGVGHVRDVLQ